MSAASEKLQKSASETYQKLTPLEHVLKRPDTYIGSVEFHEVPMWVCDSTGSIANRTVKIVPGLYKCFDEVLVNAADNKVNDPHMKNIKVDINTEEKTISVLNDGRGIPIEIHSEENIYVPELIFGHLLTSSNYNDEEEKVTGGRNGFGAKLCNIFSKKFVLETANAKKVYTQIWTDNMTKVNPPEIKSNPTSKSYTKVTFTPDLARFRMTEFDDDFVDVLRRRVYDMAGTVKGITVTLNGQAVPIKNFKGYVDLFVNSLTDLDNFTGKIIHASSTDRWEYAFALSDGNGFQQMSFVNSIATTSGGPHVDYIADQIAKHVVEQTNKGQKAGKLQRAQVRNNMFLFVNCKVNNPSFSSQTKEQLTTKSSQFGSRCEISDRFLKDCLKATGLDDRLLSITERNAANAYKKQDGGKRRRLTEYPKLIDAAKAGTREANKCTLILCEGDSAMGQAKQGLTVVGYEYFGCFPLKGKVLNVRDASQDQVMKNTEIKALKQIIGLQHKKKYDSVQGLRYGHVMLMTDQDHDGSHIKGLLINFFESSFPGLLDIPGFLREFITPIVKVTIDSGRRKGETIPFYSMPEYEKWRDSEGQVIPKWKLKYYKGLGTSETMEMKEYFADIATHEKTFQVLQDGDKEVIELVFSKSKADDRKTWLQGFEPGTYLDHSCQNIPIADFINKELILFSMADNLRSIPSVVDGLKPGQRKIMWVSLERLKKETKVRSLCGIVTMRAQYHHGDAALSQTIIGLAQDFVGSNNLYWLMPIGGYGSRDTGGKDASSDRYISTAVTPITRSVFCQDDAPVLNYLKEDESTVEPEFFVPIIPALLVNGTEGIGTGWSTNIPSYNPIDIVDNLRRLLNGGNIKPMTPWFRGWTGQIEKIPGSEHQWRVCGRIEEIDETTLAITELPVKMWTISMKEFLLKSLIGAHKNSSENEKEKDKLANAEFIEDMWEEHTDYIRFIVKISREEMAKAKEVGLYKKFKLITTISTSNMVAFDPQGRLRKYATPEDILKEFYHVRLDFYKKRRDYQLDQLKYELERLSQRARFIKLIIDRELSVNNKKRRALEQELRDLKFPLFMKNNGKPFWPDELPSDVKTEGEIDQDDEADEDELNEENANLGIDDGDESTKKQVKPPSYDYLLNMHIASLTAERYARLLRERGEAEEKLNVLLNTDIKDIWLSELDVFLYKWDEFLKEDARRRLSEVNAGKKKDSGPRGTKRKATDSGRGRTSSKRKPVNFSNSDVIPPPPIEDAIVKPKAPKGPPRIKVKKEPSVAASSIGSSKPASRSSSVEPSKLKADPKVELPESTEESQPSAVAKTRTKAPRSKTQRFAVDDISSDEVEDVGDDPFQLSD